jgi:endonuclease YncB( thermonuclease family)
LSEGRSTVPRGVGQSDHDATITVTRVVDGDTIDISPSVERRSRVRLIGMDTPEVHFGTLVPLHKLYHERSIFEPC